MAEMEKTKSCGACHSGIKAFSVASEKDCVRCHKGKPRNMAYKPRRDRGRLQPCAHHLPNDVDCKGCHNGKVITGKEKNVTMAADGKGENLRRLP